MSKITKYRFNKKWFNPLYFIIVDLYNSGVSEFYVYGGKSSAKSYTIAQFLSVYCYAHRWDCLVYRKESTIIKTTIKRTFSSAIDSCKLTNGFEPRDFSFVSKNGNIIQFKGLDKDEKVKGIEGYGGMLWDELNHFEKDEYDQALLSFRGEKAKVFFGTWNPVSDQHWIKKELIDKDVWNDTHYKLPSPDSFVRINKQGNRALIKTDYRDNFWTVGSPCGTYGYVDQKLIDKYDNLKITDPDYYDVNVLGNWGSIKTDSPYVQNISKQVNSSELAFNRRLEVYLSFDFNVKNTVTIWQRWEDYEGFHVNCLEEIHMGGGADYDLENICKLISKKYSKYSIYFTGDGSGNNKSAYTAGNSSAFVLINKYLADNGCRNLNYVGIRKNPPTKKCRFVVNQILLYLRGNFQIDRRCTGLWSDIESVPINSLGDLDKNYCNKNDIGHHLDTMRYFVWAFCYDIWETASSEIYVPAEYQNIRQNVFDGFE